MFFQNNLPTWERAIRICMGLVIGAAGFYFLPEPSMRWLAMGGGALFAGTGLIGFCPMCAMAGRKLSKREG